MSSGPAGPHLSEPDPPHAPMRRPRFIIDNSAWQRVATEPVVRAAIEAIIRTTAPDDILICPPVAAEYGFSARSLEDHSAIVLTLAGAFSDCRMHPEVRDVAAIRSALVAAHMGRAAGAVDVLIAAYAVVNRATVVHYDRDFPHIARAYPDLRQRWVVAEGSL
ncbi:PIN domain-containing protein [Frigoribacterium sp. RIT-PI-h]|uniref:PIN domain-containing protein n=1 Tax=Frigoribacterium sp. RIT-PI-h TaxID=1690245 RepID=UPI0006B8AA1D|nr:PIN domain-containing protein [Frigoribacterium sp. RIT-PI-h]